MVQIIEEKNIWEDTAARTAHGAATGYMTGADQAAIRKSVESLPKNASMQDTLNAVMGTRVYNEDSKKQPLENLYQSYAVKREEEKDRSTKAKEERDIKEHERQLKAGSAVLKKQGWTEKEIEESGGVTVEEAVKLQKVGKPDLSFSEKLKTKDAQEKYKKATQGLADSEAAIKNLERLRQLQPATEGITGYLAGTSVGSYLPFGDPEKVAEFNTSAVLASQPVLKIYNPVGAIPLGKINFVTNKFAPNSSDSQAVIEGKLNFLERLHTNATDYNKHYIELFDKYDGLIPAEELVDVANSGSEMIDLLESQNTSQDGTVSGYFDSKTGKPMKPMPFEDALQLIKAGVITNAPS